MRNLWGIASWDLFLKKIFLRMKLAKMESYEILKVLKVRVNNSNNYH